MKIVSDIEKIGAVDVNQEIEDTQVAIMTLVYNLQEKYNVHGMLITGMLEQCKLTTMITIIEEE